MEFFRMGWRRPADLHSNEAWRAQVSNFLAGDWEEPQDQEVSELESAVEQLLEVDGKMRTVEPIGRFAQAIYIDRPFVEDGDGCVPSSFQDYSENRCWICQDCTPQGHFDMWLSCHHIFCSKCSTEMLRRRMPCPLCRVASSTVLRGESIQQQLPAPSPRPCLLTNPRRSLLVTDAGTKPEQQAMFQP